ncbi:SNF2-related protein [Bradyrhizobium sp. JYMT SZCCT0180]|uniref:DEAD/DEAH box helicase n=1 Tax=Bradyrhizobium sp. JYMT SZCCT0180 TaxID=2807666 RepID=UPI001BA9DCAD|nr:SNF2-related protein [Bradyrhizobium sp. JYMT SZCCT0180]MBR1213552.1 DEAD/DEAH box helicase [Bradyrhizobium sp. JYMT SZCCT0180]
MDATSEFKTKILSRKRAPEEYRLYRAGLEWDLTDPIVIERAEDLKSTYRWHDRLTPYLHQVSNLITFCRRLPVTLLADDVGLGKTISAGLVISELVARSRLSKILIVCPKILAHQWKEELESKFDIPASVAFGKDLIEAEPDEVGAVITTYNSARLHLDKIPEDRFQMLVLDEAHKLRNLYGVQKPPEVAKRFRKALKDRRFPFVLMLTATPIQNRLWDLYSLVDLLTVARGHDNPFGSPGMFARRFIADNREQARELKLEARDEFRSIVYGYMSRVRRGDAKLYFPERKVLRHEVQPTAAELRLIETIAKPIQKLNKLTQISILQALTSSPEALSAQLTNMARNGTVPPDLAASVKSIVEGMPLSAKLIGLSNLIGKLKAENPNGWRLVVFTIRRETQTTIQNYLAGQGLKVGLINGDSGERNQETISLFRKNPPGYRVIVSTEAGSEGVNLQVANVLVNYDLPWNPMIVEQRIGRVQRLASDHAYVSIYNVTLKGTFEDYIVGRLMEKLQMAAHAIGDVEALLQGADVGDGDDDAGTSFEEQILKLVIAALAGKDIDRATKLAEKSIEEAKTELEREEKTINDMLGGADGSEDVGPRTPTLPKAVRSMEPRDFTLGALGLLGSKITPGSNGLYLAEENGGREYIRFDDQADPHVRSILYGPGSPPFQRLVTRIVASGIHDVEDVDRDPAKKCEETAHSWVDDFGARTKSVEIDSVSRAFNGAAVVRVRATVAHDSYERLVDIPCSADDHRLVTGRSGLDALPRTIEKPETIGLKTEKLKNAAAYDEGISEFCRFYLERREYETRRTEDERKRKKLMDEFTPNLEMTLVGMTGAVHREVKVKTRYSFDTVDEYESSLSISPHAGKVVDGPELGLCSQTGRTVPSSCLSKCEITGADALRHLLVKSEVSGRFALPEFTVLCSSSGKRVFRDETEVSDVTGNLVSSKLLKVSAVSGKRAEPEHYEVCSFTQAEVLKEEIAVSEISGKRYRTDQQLRSAVSGRTGHKQEFVICHETRQPIIQDEAERCDVTGYSVRIGVLERCEVSGKNILPIGLDRCAISGKRALKRFFVSSSLSDTRLLKEIAVQSAGNLFCTPAETKTCVWSGRKYHPDDIRKCELSGLAIHFQFATSSNPHRLLPLLEMLDGVKRNSDGAEKWSDVAERIAAATKRGKYYVEAAILSPDGQHLATCSEIRTMLGLRVYQVGAIYDLASNSVVGRICVGKRRRESWTEATG